MLKLGVLCSGGLGLKTLQQIIKAYDVCFILTDSNSTEICKLADENNIPVFAGNPRGGKGYRFIKDIEVDVIASINYLFLIDEDIIGHSNKLTFNIHGSLLPKYRGRTPHVWAIINGEKNAGITAHQIDAGCDTGKILFQIKVAINKEDTGADILKKYEKKYFPLVKKVLNTLKNNTLKLLAQDESKASYYGKRTPEDGEIDWNWKREDIRNWVRAQSFPYPGAYTFLNSKKIIIDKVSLSRQKSSKELLNGQIIKNDPYVIVKTEDGALRLDEIRTENCIFTVGQYLGNENRK